MTREEFIQRNIKKILISEGFSHEAAEVGADAALDLYLRKSDFPNGKAFDFCLMSARREAKMKQSAMRIK
jgi:hypothetical protein|nr:MAG TPA: hypothetical protein [Caudoviricetes sp.]